MTERRCLHCSQKYELTPFNDVCPHCGFAVSAQEHEAEWRTIRQLGTKLTNEDAYALNGKIAYRDGAIRFV